KDVEQLRLINPTIELITGYKNDGKDSVQLNAPMFKNIKDPSSSIFIDKSLVLHLTHPVKGVDIRYNISNKDPDSNSFSFLRDTTIANNTFIKARAYKQGWVGSDVAKFQFLKSAVEPDSVALL